MYPEAVDSYLKAQSLDGAPPEISEGFREAFRVSGWHGFLRRRLEALKMKAKTGQVEPFQFADLYVRLGQKDEAFAWLEKTFEARDASTLQVKVEPAFDSLRNDPRYAPLIRKIGLQP
jgi:hypothetical protein